MSPFRQHVTSVGFPIRVQYKKYAGIATSIATQAFRAIQRFLQNFCGVLVESLPKPDIRILYSILLNYKAYSRQFCPTDEYFGNYSLFLRAGYNMAPEGAQVEALSVYKTYQSILKLLMVRGKEVDPQRYDEREKISVFRQEKDRVFCKKIITFKTQPVSKNIKLPQNVPLKADESFPIGSFDEANDDAMETSILPNEGNRHIVKTWNDQSQEELASFFIQLQDLAKIRERYRQIYGCITMFENMNILRSYVYKIIRKSLRRAQKIVRVYADELDAQVGQVISLRQDERYVQYVLTSPEFLNARILLCRLHNMKMKNLPLIEQIARALMIGLNSRMDHRRPYIRR